MSNTEMLHSFEDLHIYSTSAANPLGAADVQINSDNAGATNELENKAMSQRELPIRKQPQILPRRAERTWRDDTRTDLTPDAEDHCQTIVTQSAHLFRQRFEDQAAALEQALMVGSQQQRFGYVESADQGTCCGTTHLAESFTHVRRRYSQALLPEPRDQYALDDNRLEPLLSRSNADDQQENEEKTQALEYGRNQFTSQQLSIYRTEAELESATARRDSKSSCERNRSCPDGRDGLWRRLFSHFF